MSYGRSLGFLSVIIPLRCAQAMSNRTAITSETADQLLTEWAEEGHRVVMALCRGETPTAVITCWNGTLQVENAGVFRHTSGSTVNLITPGAFTVVEWIENEHFPSLHLRRGTGVSRLLVILGLQMTTDESELPPIAEWAN